jgi:hypothetical protein
MPLDMTIVFEDNVEIGITGETDNAGSWRCKEVSEYSTSCSDNFMVQNDAGDWETADTAPCYADTIEVIYSLPPELMLLPL